VRVCVVGSGGREHALASALSRSATVVVTPGNPGIEAISPGVACSAQSPEALDADLFVIGPEAALVDGLADRLRREGRRVFGPGADGARLEGSKAWMKQLLVDAGVPTAAHGTFDALEPATEFLRSLPGGPYVVKTDGLAAGKGVLVTDSLADAIDDCREKLSGVSFGAAGQTVVIEEGLSGQELSVMALCDGRRAVALAPAQDFKRIGEGDRGPNTGGMGAFSPVSQVDEKLLGVVMDTGIEPTLAALRTRGIDYRGVLYAGLMLTNEGPKVLEYNVRFGDPETQVVLPRYDGDLAALLAEVAAGQLTTTPRFVDEAAVCVVLAAEGYPESPRIGDPIEGLDDAGRLDRISVFHAGTRSGEEGRVVTAGGRVLGVTAVDGTIELARSRTYQAVTHLRWPGMQHRTDIATARGHSMAVPSFQPPTGPDPHPTQEVSR
jgi:phosphoribosylamine---glycine ligase